MLPDGVSDNLISSIPMRYREDAEQEAWVGYLEAKRDGTDPIEGAKKAVWTYANKERANEQAPAKLIQGIKDRATRRSMDK